MGAENGAAEIGPVTIRVSVGRKEWGGTAAGGSSTEAVCGAEMVLTGAGPGTVAAAREKLRGYCEETVETILAGHRGAAAPPSARAPEPAADRDEPRRREPEPDRDRDRDRGDRRSGWGSAYRGNGNPERERDRLRDREDRRSGSGGGNGRGGNRSGSPPTSGGQLVKCLKDRDERDGSKLWNAVKAWGKRNELPELMRDWDRREVEDAWAFANEREGALRESEEFQESLN